MWLGTLPTLATHAASSQSRWGAWHWVDKWVGPPHVPWELQLLSCSLASPGDMSWPQDTVEDEVGGH